MSTSHTPAPTLDDVWRAFMETDRRLDQRFQETERLIKQLSKNLDEKFQETDLKFQETDRKFQKTDLRFQETERLIKQLSKNLDDKFQETDLKFQETDRKFQKTDLKFQETDRLIKQLSKNLGELGNRLGEFVEHQVAPAVVRLFRAQGIEVHEVYPGVSAKRNGEALEIDLLVVNDGALVAVECKSKLSTEHIDAHLIRLEKLKRVLPLYKDHQVMGAVAGMVIPTSVADEAIAKGLYVLCQNGEHIEVRNPAVFTPAVW
ncbi:hypothetical protein [Thiorhodospira sibirica]|uniref:hypothetical protein n=1 Tax=Thiorhodospira sibirica TaxID=154347 RepID=UPI000593630C|nr:hypothetical protein [Thiorhodospira sibirica]